MQTLKRILAEYEQEKLEHPATYQVSLNSETLTAAVREHDDALGMLTAFRHAANSLAIEAGVIASHVEHSEVEKSILQDVYFLQLIAEAELRLKSLSVRYERLRAAAFNVCESRNQEQTEDYIEALREALQDG